MKERRKLSQSTQEWDKQGLANHPVKVDSIWDSVSGIRRFWARPGYHTAIMYI